MKTNKVLKGELFILALKATHVFVSICPWEVHVQDNYTCKRQLSRRKKIELIRKTVELVATLSRYPRVRGSIPPLGTLGNASENQFLGST